MGDRVVTEITPGLVQEYRVHRMTSRIDKKTGLPKRPSRSTMHHEIITLRHVLKTANRHGWLPYVHDREGNPRTSCSLRHTYICFRLMEGADIYQIAKNCRTSVEMIEKYYASHIKNMLDASAINVRRAK
jgi:hypothetical protein